MRAGNISKNTAYDLLNELKDAGYVTMEQGISANGTFVNVRYLLYEEPLPEIWEPAPLAENPEAAHGKTPLPDFPEALVNTESLLVKTEKPLIAGAIDEAAAEEYSTHMECVAAPAEMTRLLFICAHQHENG